MTGITENTGLSADEYLCKLVIVFIESTFLMLVLNGMLRAHPFDQLCTIGCSLKVVVLHVNSLVQSYKKGAGEQYGSVCLES
jgi:hypothetical protein